MIATLILAIHIAAGGVGLLSGATALAFRKGGRIHRLAGRIFAASMLIVTAMAVYLGVNGPFGIGASLSGALAFYLVATAWLTVRRKARGVGAAEFGGFLLGLCVIAAYAILLVQAPAGSAAAIAGPLVGVGIAGLGVGFDLAMILRGGISGAGRIARHVWRVCVPFFMANSFFFLAQPDIFVGIPLPLLAVPPLAVLTLMVVWLVRVPLTKRFRTSVAA